MSGNSNQAKVEGLFGATGCGKTTEFLKRLKAKKRKRTMIWSPKEAIDNYAAIYPGSHVVTTVADALKIMKAAGKGEFHIVFRPKLNRDTDTKQFNVVAKACMLARDVTMAVDEMHTVVLPSWSPDGWNQLVMIGRGYGSEVFGLSQRPASVDKNFFGNLSKLRTGRLVYEEDIKTMAKALRVPVSVVASLKGFEWIERDNLTGEVTADKNILSLIRSAVA